MLSPKQTNCVPLKLRLGQVHQIEKHNESKKKLVAPKKNFTFAVEIDRIDTGECN